jgi:hypothetical protein
MSHVACTQGNWVDSRLLVGLSQDAMVGEYVISNAHNSSFTLEFTTYFCPSYFVAQEANVAPKVLTTR